MMSFRLFASFNVYLCGRGIGREHVGADGDVCVINLSEALFNLMS